MKVKFFESDVYEFPDSITDEELEKAANDWVSDNAGAGYETINEE